MKKILLILIALTLVISCASKRPIFQSPYQYPGLDSPFRTVPKHAGKDLEDFVIKVPNISDTTIVEKNNYSGIVAISAIIDKKGNVETTFLKKSLEPQIDSLVLKAAYSSKFKRLSNHRGAKIKYYIDLTYIFYNGEVLSPLVNGKSVWILSKKKFPKTKGSDSKEYFKVSKKPILSYRATPKYSTEALKANVEGTVVATVTIGKRGDVIAMNIFQSPHDLLILSTLDAARKCKFEPAIQRNKPVLVRMNIPFKYRLMNK